MSGFRLLSRSFFLHPQGFLEKTVSAAGGWAPTRYSQFVRETKAMCQKRVLWLEFRAYHGQVTDCFCVGSRPESRSCVARQFA